MGKKYGKRERSQSGELEVAGCLYLSNTKRRGKKSEIKNDRHRARFGYMMDNSKQGQSRAERERESV